MSTIPDARRCTKCGECKPLDEYYVKDKRTGRLFSWCKSCHIARTMARYVRHPQAPKPLPNEKPCAKCGAILPASAFSRNGTRLKSWCRDCLRAAKREYDESHREARSEYQRRYWQANKVEHGERIRRSIAKDPDKYRAIHSAWKTANKGAVNASTHKRRARVKGNGGSWTAAEWEAIKAAQGHRCLMCGRPEPEITLCFDHIIPLSEGGPNTAANGQGLCRSCNSTKHRRTLDLRRKAT